MSKVILISNKTYGHLQHINQDYCHDNGTAYSSDRFFYILNQSFDYRLRLKNPLIAWWIKFWYYTTDYKKNQSLSNKHHSILQIIEKIIYLGCIIGLILALIFGLAIPIITSTTKSLLLIRGEAQGAIYANNQLIGYVFTNSEAAGILKLIGTDSSYYTQPAIANALHQLNLTPDQVDKMIFKVGSTFMIVQLTSSMQELLHAFFVANQNQIGGLDISKLQTNDLILNTDQAGQAILVPKIWISYFDASNVIVPIVFTIIFIAVIWAYDYRKKKIMPKVNSMSIQDYLILKLNLVKKFNQILNKNIPMLKGISQLNHQFVFNMENVGNSQIYFNLRLLNYTYSIFSDLDCIMVLMNQDDNAIKELMKIIAQDFKQNLEITIVNSEDTSLLKANNALGFLFNSKQFKELTTDPITLNLTEDQELSNDAKAFYASNQQAIYDHKLAEIDLQLQQKLNYAIFKYRNSLNEASKQLILQDIMKQYQQKKKDLMQKYDNALTDLMNHQTSDEINNKEKEE